MNTIQLDELREKLHQFIDKVEDRKIEAMYTMFEEKIEETTEEYTDEFKSELDERLDDYQKHNNAITEDQVKEEIRNLLDTYKK